jgi:hypothetical protein
MTRKLRSQLFFIFVKIAETPAPLCRARLLLFR